MPFPNRRLTHVKTLTEFELGFIIGLIDGEGTITINDKIRKQRFVWKNKPKNKKDYRQLIPHVSVCNTNLEIIEKVKETINCGYITVNKARPEHNQKEHYRFHLENLSDIEQLLNQISEKLIVKRKQAKILLEFCRLRLDKMALHPNRIDLARYGDEEKLMVEEIRKLNKRGLR